MSSPSFSLRNRYYFLLDCALLSLTPFVALFLRVDVEAWTDKYRASLLLFTVLTLALKLPVLYLFGLYRRYWRYAGIGELLAVSGAVGITTLASAALLLGGMALKLFPGAGLPRSVPLLDGLLALVVVGGTRLSLLAFASTRGEPSPSERARRKRVLLVGASDAGVILVNEMRANSELGLEPVGFVDDDRGKHNAHIHGVPVVGTRADIPGLIQDYKIDEVIIALPSAPGKVIREIVMACEAARVPSRTVPGFYEILSGKVDFNRLRKVEIEDLLRREPVETDMEAVARFIRGKRVLVTGGGGSIGGELCRQVVECGPEALMALGHGENSIFEITNELTRTANAMWNEIHSRGRPPAICAAIADIRFPERMRAILSEYRPDIVFHAAAHKHVPLMEANLAEAITTNVLGTRNVVEAALAAGARHFVLISSDKAVNPTSIMGASKRVAELLVRRAAVASGRPYVAVRFGNVLGSRGSVVLTFRRQIAAGGPVTVTHPDMLRYFMTIPEAVQLVLQAAVLGKGGEVFVLDMGEPVKIADLARDMIRLSGLEVGADIDIEFTGLRPGEKLYEELFVPGETYGRTGHEKIFITGQSNGPYPCGLQEQIAELEAAALKNDAATLLRCLQTLVPEFKSGA